MHPTAHTNAELAALKAEVAELKALLAPVITQAAEDEAAHEKAEAQAQAQTAADASYAAWQGQRASADADHIAATLDYMARDGEGNLLPAEHYRGPDGIIRTRQGGQRVEVAERQQEEVATVRRGQADEYRTWKRSVELPIRTDDLYPTHPGD